MNRDADRAGRRAFFEPTDPPTPEIHHHPRLADPEGRRSLFETPAEPDAGTVGAGHAPPGREVFFSTGPHQTGTVVIECSSCGERSRVLAVEAVLRVLSLSLWFPGRRHSRWIRCPSCHQRAWCRIGWAE